ncbi:hypothetical protein [Nitratireductor sp. XY-223]|uniref:hypothetical protein n=1 Tax=Nitratireductor sp. XY-223 TaxID=2561926 RepID=UPI0010A9FC8A|nr:hypothetical protein [Nitratireductor sp. XY-223]
MLRWLKKTREGHGCKTYWLHRIGTLTAIGLLIYWWRAAKHFIDSLNAGLEGWVKSGSFFLGWIEGLWSAVEFALAQPIYLIQVAVCCAIVTGKEAPRSNSPGLIKTMLVTHFLLRK